MTKHLMKSKVVGRSYVQTFDYWGDMLEFCDKAPAKSGADKASRTGEEDFTGTETWEEAHELAVNGWKEGKEKILKGKKELFDSAEKLTRPTFFKSVAGSFPSVASYVANQPKSMYRRVRRETNIPILEIHLNPVGPWNLSKQCFINYGGYLLNLIEEQENNGRRCEVYVTYHSSFSEGKSVISCKLKGSGEFADIDFLSFALAHPSSLRRVMFAAMERSEHKEIVSETQIGYGCLEHGRPVTLDEEAIWLGAVDKKYEDKDKCITMMDKVVEKELKRIGLM